MRKGFVRDHEPRGTKAMRPILLSLRVLSALRFAPMTVYDLARCLHASGASVRRNVDELLAAGLADRTGLKAARKSRPAVVFAATA